MMKRSVTEEGLASLDAGFHTGADSSRRLDRFQTLAAGWDWELRWQKPRSQDEVIAPAGPNLGRIAVMTEGHQTV